MSGSRRPKKGNACERTDKREKRGCGHDDRGRRARLLAAFALPLLAGNVLQQLYNMVDSFVVGNYVGATALAAVGTGFPIVYLLASLFIGFSMGATVMIAQYVGAGDLDRVKDTVDTLYSAFAVLILPLTVVGDSGLRPAAAADPGARGRLSGGPRLLYGGVCGRDRHPGL